MAHSADDRPWEIGRKLKALRLNAGLTIEEAAGHAEIQPEHLSSIEEDGGGSKHRGPSVRVAERVANVYGRSVDIV